MKGAISDVDISLTFSCVDGISTLLGDLMNKLQNGFKKPSKRVTTAPCDELDSTFTLANTIRSARMIVVAPLANAAYQIPMLISSANYTGALKCALASSVCFLILAISTTLADFLSRLAGHKVTN